MRFSAIQKILGLLLMVFSTTLLPPVAVSFWYNDGAHDAFVTAFFITLAIGTLSWAPVRKYKRDMRMRDGFIVVVMFWFVLSAIGALPFMLSVNPHLTLTDSMFEAISGLTTTGATVITQLEELPRSILYYRQQLQWLGGMGIVVLAVAVLPLLGIGGMQLY
ncbi:MAG: potassium transporter, partial [Gammaproteobacteria bacterium]|nr:potassium transporter [Gammaproteobacteria bacterium]